MKLHLPLSLRKALLALIIPGSFAIHAFAADVSGIGFDNPDFNQSVDHNLNFVEYRIDNGWPWYRIYLSSHTLQFLPSDSEQNRHSVSFTPSYYDSGNRSGRAIKMENGSSLEIGFMDAVSFTGHNHHKNSDGNSIDGLTYGGAIYASSSVLNFHNNNSVLFENNNVYTYGGAIYLYNSDLSIKYNSSVIFRGNGVINDPGKPLSGWYGGGGIHVAGTRQHKIELLWNTSLSFTGNANVFNGGAISSSHDITTDGERMLLEVCNNETILFSNNISSGAGGAISWTGGRYSSLSFYGNKQIKFSGNIANSSGGALNALSISDFTNNGHIVFTNNQAGGDGGAFINDSCPASFSSNASLTFSNNTASLDGGAIYGGPSCPITIEDNDSLIFSNNNANSGGAISATCLIICNNDTVEFLNNTATKGAGGAVKIKNGWSSSPGRLIIEGQNSAIFSKNSSTGNGGAIYFGTPDSYARFSKNKLLTFSDNSTTKNGGAIYVENGDIPFSSNDSLIFRTNTAGESGGAICSELGLSITDNKLVIFQENSAINKGGAIWANQGLYITGNKSVIFNGNHVLQYDATGVLTGAILNSIVSPDKVELSTPFDNEKGEIVFYDPLTIGGISITLNSYVSSHDSLRYAGIGRIVFSGERSIGDLTEIFKKNGLETSSSVFEECLAASRISTMKARVVLAGGSLEVTNDAVLKITEGYTANSGSSTFLGNKGELSIGRTANFQANSTLGVHPGGKAPGMITAQVLSMTDATLDCGTTAGSTAASLIVNSNMTLADSDVIFRAGLTDEGIYSYGNGGIRVNGTLTVTGDTRIIFAQGYEELAFLAPKGSIGLFTIFNEEGNGSSFTGNPETWKYLLKKGENYQNINLSEEQLISMGDSNGNWNIRLVLEDTPLPPDPTPDEIIVYANQHESISDLLVKVRLEGGTLDATSVDPSTPLTNSVISGSDGLLKMTAEQTLSLQGKVSIGYDISGSDEEEIAGEIVIGNKNGSLSQTTVSLNGERYDVRGLNVLSGIAIIEKTAELGKADTTDIILGSSQEGEVTTTSLINEGTIRSRSLNITSNAALTNKNRLESGIINIQGQSALFNEGELVAHNIQVASRAILRNTGNLHGDVSIRGTMTNNGKTDGSISVLDGGHLYGSGEFASVAVSAGACLTVGNSGNPGTPLYENLTLEQGSFMIFSVDGITPASSNSSRNGTHSHARVTTLTANGTPTVGIDISTGLIAAGSDSFTLTLLNAGNVVGDGAFNPNAFTLMGDIELLEEGSTLLWDPISGTLSFTGKVNGNYASFQAGNDAALIADTLWSSTSSVVSFARTAVSQGRISGDDSFRLWMSGLGHFTTMSSANTLSGFSYNGGGYAVGSDFVADRNFTLGAALGQMFGSHGSNDKLLSDKQRSLMIAFYGNYKEAIDDDNVLDISGVFSYGSVDHTARTHIGGSFDTPGRAYWDDNVYSFGLQANWNIKVSDTLSVVPFTGITYIYGNQGAIDESFSDGSRRFENGGMQSWSIPLGITLKTFCELGDNQILVPELSVAYVGDIARRNPTVRTWANGQEVTGQGHNPGRNALMVKIGLGWQINEKWTTGAYYTLETRSGQTNQNVNLNVSYDF